jgi:hypothetical protein
MGVIQDTCLNDTHKGREEFSEVRGSKQLISKATAALLLAFVVSLGTLGVAQATHKLSAPKVGRYEVGGSAADRMLSKNGEVVATWSQVKVHKGEWVHSWRAYWSVENKSSKPQQVCCAGYQKHGGLRGYEARVQDHTGVVETVKAKDALCRDLGGDYRRMLQPGQNMTS